jgi:hypothetical protein
MNEVRMLTILVQLDSKKHGGTMLLLPFEVEWLTGNTCRELLHHVLVDHLDHPTALVTAEVVKLFCTKQEVVTESGLTARLEKEVANATGCMDMIVMSVVKAFSTMSFSFKIWSRPTSAPSRPQINPFDIMRQTQIGYISVPSRLTHVRILGSTPYMQSVH